MQYERTVWLDDTSWKPLEDVLRMPWRRFCKTSWRCLEDVLRKPWQDLLKMSWRRLEDAWPRRRNWFLSKRFQDVLKTSSEDVWVRQMYLSWWSNLKDVFRIRRRKTSSRRLQQDEYLLGVTSDAKTKAYVPIWARSVSY